MSDFGLTQDQIDAMLNNVAGSPPSLSANESMQALSDFETQTMANLPSVLNALTGFEYKLSGVECAPTTAAELVTLLDGELVFSIPFTAGDQLTHLMVLDQQFAKSIAASLTGSGEGTELTLGPMELSAIVEVISQANGTYLTSLSRALGMPTTGEMVSQIEAADVPSVLSGSAVIASLYLEQPSGDSALVRHVIPAALAERIVQRISEAAAPAPPRATASPAPAAAAASAAQPLGAAMGGMSAAQPSMQVPVATSGNVVGANSAAAVQFSPAGFSQLSAPSTPVDQRNLDILMDVPLQVTVELGKTSIPIRQILEYGQGSLITLDKLAGEPIDLLVNGKYFAKGEVVVIDENFGVRITSILSPADRIAQLT
jgi:flagellar motor switch protein FliN